MQLDHVRTHLVVPLMHLHIMNIRSTVVSDRRSSRCSIKIISLNGKDSRRRCCLSNIVHIGVLSFQILRGLDMNGSLRLSCSSRCSSVVDNVRCIHTFGRYAPVCTNHCTFIHLSIQVRERILVSPNKSSPISWAQQFSLLVLGTFVLECAHLEIPQLRFKWRTLNEAECEAHPLRRSHRSLQRVHHFHQLVLHLDHRSLRPHPSHFTHLETMPVPLQELVPVSLTHVTSFFFNRSCAISLRGHKRMPHLPLPDFFLHAIFLDEGVGEFSALVREELPVHGLEAVITDPNELLFDTLHRRFGTRRDQHSTFDPSQNS
mmetsp:Transcript_3463/g.9027  ORF Transcript_3463/g.9027 Transcript_3463/m.9027 type:complete len:317 (-) Transcript_3463:1102-2052(-)